MEAMEIADKAMRTPVSLLHLAQNVLTDSVWVELAQKVMPELPENMADWSLDDIRALLPLLDSEASRITQRTFPDLEFSTYDCEKIFQTRIAILRTLLDQPHTHINAWKFSGTLSEKRQTLNDHVTTTRQGIQDIAGHFAGLATATVLARNDFTEPPPELRATIAAACAKVRKEVMMGN